MRLALVSLAIVLAIPGTATAQTYWVGDSLSPKVKVGSCPMADSMFGPAPKGVMKSQVHGQVDGWLSSGPMRYNDRLPVTLEMSPKLRDEHQLPGGFLTMWFYGSIMKAERDPAKPFTVVVDDTMSYVLGMPDQPTIHGPTPEVIYYRVIITPEAVQALSRARKARVDFLGKKQEINNDRLEEIQGTARIVVCYRAGQGLQRD